MGESVRDIYVSALSLKDREQPPAAIRQFIMDRAKANGLDVTVQFTGAGQDFIFGNGERISSDGTDWHHHLP